MLGGTQSLHTNSYDEALALPTEEAVTIALRTQQMIAARDRRDEHRGPARRLLLRRVAHRRDGAARYEYFAKIDELGGMVEAVKRNYPQREIADAAFALQQEIDAGERIVVGVNSFLARRRGADPHPARRPRARAQADRPPAGRARRAATAPPSSAHSPRCARTPPARGAT